MRTIAISLLAVALHAQDYGTVGYDAHRTSWIRGDAKINPASMKKPGFGFLWKQKLSGTGLTAAPVINFYIGYRGFRSLAWVGSNADKVFAFDTDPVAQDLCRKMAELNGVADRVSVAGFCSSDLLRRFRFVRRGLVISDCEGYEKTLFRPDVVRNLVQCVVLIEIHDFIECVVDFSRNASAVS